MYPSIGIDVNFAAKKDIATQLEVNTSPKASTEAAFNAEELIVFPMCLLNLESHTLRRMETKSKIKGINSNTTISGFIIF